MFIFIFNSNYGGSYTLHDVGGYIYSFIIRFSKKKEKIITNGVRGIVLKNSFLINNSFSANHIYKNFFILKKITYSNFITTILIDDFNLKRGKIKCGKFTKTSHNAIKIILEGLDKIPVNINDIKMIRIGTNNGEMNSIKDPNKRAKYSENYNKVLDNIDFRLKIHLARFAKNFYKNLSSINIYSYNLENEIDKFFSSIKIHPLNI